MHPTGMLSCWVYYFPAGLPGGKFGPVWCLLHALKVLTYSPFHQNGYQFCPKCTLFEKLLFFHNVCVIIQGCYVQ